MHVRAYAHVFKRLIHYMNDSACGIRIDLLYHWFGSLYGQLWMVRM